MNDFKFIEKKCCIQIDICAILFLVASDGDNKHRFLILKARKKKLKKRLAIT